MSRKNRRKIALQNISLPLQNVWRLTFFTKLESVCRNTSHPSSSSKSDAEITTLESWLGWILTKDIEVCAHSASSHKQQFKKRKWNLTLASPAKKNWAKTLLSKKFQPIWVSLMAAHSGSMLQGRRKHVRKCPANLTKWVRCVFVETSMEMVLSMQ